MQKRWKKMKKGLLTVEASVIVPLCFLVTALMIALLYFEHNRVYYCAAACEAAVCGNFWYSGQEEGEAAAGIAAEQRIRDAPVPGQKPEVSVQSSQTGTKVTFSHSLSHALGYDWPAYRTEVQADHVKPADSLRLSWTLKSMTEG
ncbi:MAG: hypothetical protein U0L49_02320 [Eubacterium sp.]|nr:hypothetical protein [Eubacterium sp.]